MIRLGLDTPPSASPTAPKAVADAKASPFAQVISALKTARGDDQQSPGDDSATHTRSHTGVRQESDTEITASTDTEIDPSDADNPGVSPHVADAISDPDLPEFIDTLTAAESQEPDATHARQEATADPENLSVVESILGSAIATDPKPGAASQDRSTTQHIGTEKFFASGVGGVQATSEVARNQQTGQPGPRTTDLSQSVPLPTGARESAKSSPNSLPVSGQPNAVFPTPSEAGRPLPSGGAASNDTSLMRHPTVGFESVVMQGAGKDDKIQTGPNNYPSISAAELEMRVPSKGAVSTLSDSLAATALSDGDSAADRPDRAFPTVSKTVIGSEFVLMDEPFSPIIMTQDSAIRAALPSDISGSRAPQNIPAPIAPQIVDALETIRAQGGGTVELALSPEELGQVRITLQRGDAGYHVTIHAERDDTLILMRRHSDALEAAMRDLDLGQVDISFGQSERNDDRRDGGASGHQVASEAATGKADNEQHPNRQLITSHGRLDLKL